MRGRVLQINILAGAMFWVMAGWLIYNAFRLPEWFMWGSNVLVVGMLTFNWLSKKYTSNIDLYTYSVFCAFFFWLLISFVRACNYAEGYWMWKFVLAQGLITLFYLMIVLSTDVKLVRDYLRLYWYCYLPLFAVSMSVYGTPQNVSYTPFLLLSVLIFALPRNQKLFLCAILTIYIVTFEHRNDVMKVIFSVSTGLSVHLFKSAFSIRVLKFVRIFFLGIPLLFLYLGFSGVFNIFKMSEYINSDLSYTVKSGNELELRDLRTDTRSFIYKNVYFTLNKYDDILWGRSPAYGDEGGTFEDSLVTKLKGRYGNEVGVMDILLWYGVVGFILYFLLYVRATDLAISRSNNRFSKGLGIYTSFTWLMSFIWEKPLIETFFMTDLILLGLCYSKTFRSMTDHEIESFVRTIFSKNLKSNI